MSEIKMNPSHKRWAELKGFATREEEEARAQEESQVKCAWDEISDKPEAFKPEEHTHDQYATTEDVEKKIAALVDSAPETLDTLKELADALNEKGDATAIIEQIASVDAKVDAISLESLGYEEPDLTPYALKSELPVLPEDHVTKKELEDVVASIPSVDGLASEKFVEEKIAAVDHSSYAIKSEVEASINEVKNMIPEVPSHDKVVEYQDFTFNGQTRKTIQLANYDSISGVATTGEGHNLVMLSKWDVADFGATGVHLNLNTKDTVTINDNKVVATLDDVTEAVDSIVVPSVEGLATEEFVNTKITEVEAKIPVLPEDHITKEELELAIEEVESKIPSIPTDHATVEELAAAIFRINTLEDKVIGLSKTNISPVVAGTSVNDATADLVITASETPVTSNVSYTGKSVEIKSMNVESAKVTMTAKEGDLTISGYTSTGNIDGNVVEINAFCGEHVKITNCVLGQGGYNAINIGNTSTTIDNAPKSVLIDNVQLNGIMRNNAINIYGQQDNAVITISNCHFEGVSNPVRLFNTTNTSCTVNFINCTVAAWEADESEIMYSGFLLCEDATSDTVEAEIANNRFSRNKITVNFINCYGPHGKIESADPATFCGTRDASQLVYVFRHEEWRNNKETDPAAGVMAYGDGSIYPAITIK